MSNIFGGAISTNQPLSLFAQRPGETAVPANISNASPVETNSFYGNMLVATQDCSVFTHPYSVTYAHANNNYGLTVYHAQQSDRVFGPGTPASYFYSPTGIQELVFTAADFDQNFQFALIDMSKFAATARFTATNNGYMDCPMVQGMGFVTAIYNNLVPQINSSVGFQSVQGTTSPRSGILKFIITLLNGTTWSLYATIPSGQSLSFKLQGNNSIITSNSVDGAVFQLCVGQDDHFDLSAGCYPTGSSITASVNGSTCIYQLNYSVSGTSNNGTTLIFAAPHHVAAFTSSTAATATSLTALSTTLGLMTGCLTNTLQMQETIPTNMGWGPYTTISGNSANYTANAISSITNAANSEVNDDVVSMANVDSMYTSGKILLKYALVLYTTHFILENSSLTNTLLPKLKSAIEIFTNNTQIYPLFYDTNFKGIVSSATGDADYGNGHYNDHHFHWGYHIHACAIVSKVDKDLGGNWLTSIEDCVNTLVRDVANPTLDDPYFPMSRSFDYFVGHSWAKGLYASADGKDEESSSEDVNHAYAVKCWGNIIGDSNMENRGNLMLALLRRSLNSYFLYEDNNTIEPSNYIGNKVSGILFENKCDYTTYFGTLVQYIHGIHMLPIMGASSFIRGPTFVQQEWDEILASIINGVPDGWKGILMLNVALYDPTTAYNFFNSSSFSDAYLDNGQSLTWSLAYCAGVGASS
ncbi:uncharacterized protein RJT21DRAFT_109563 [Scheffersomyces amazonensis]|uniref:uncharacterized protein n=1 Tax=Scheffersomyces amazonensis TaxID=1078765 RepID=UPI00315CD79E